MSNVLLRLELSARNRKWKQSIKKILKTKDYGMCCDAVQAIRCSKEYWFDTILDKAEELGYFYELNSHRI